MKLIVCFVLMSFSGIAQNSYIEWNAGAALISDDYLDGWFPGTSVLIGNRYDLDDQSFLDAEIGVAFPSLVTAKIGLGVYLSKEDKSALVFGIRPWPLHGYAQINISETRIGQWILSGEYGNGGEYSFYSNAIVNVGYRWKLMREKKK